MPGWSLAAGLLSPASSRPRSPCWLARRGRPADRRGRGARSSAGIVELLDGAPTCSPSARRPAPPRRWPRSTTASSPCSARCRRRHRARRRADGAGDRAAPPWRCTALGVAAVARRRPARARRWPCSRSPRWRAPSWSRRCRTPRAGWSTAAPAARRLAELERAPAAGVRTRTDPRAASPSGPARHPRAHRALAGCRPGRRDRCRPGAPRRRAARADRPDGLWQDARCWPRCCATSSRRPGAVLVDGVDTRELLGDDVRARIAWCGPATHLFDSTLRQNLLLARPDARTHELVDALRRARLGDWLAGAARRAGHPGRRATAGRSPAGSASASGSPGRCSPTVRCCCSTSRPRTSTSETAARVAADLLRGRRGARRSS